ncbi:hypothetical protein DSM07_00020 [Oenococcus sp. UCMA 16435]|nr:hypothetical protein DSM07_00020 [Oenococcus sp. UCMA 16435]
MNETDVAKYLLNFVTVLTTAAGKSPSGGQKVAFGLMLKLEEAKKSTIALIDEPEASLDNHFINCELIDELREISQNIPIFVVTHNSTLGTLLKPDRLIVTKYDESNDKYRILSGDFKSKKIIDAENNGQIPSFEDFLDSMEAGFDTYKEKGDNYEFLKN